ncbi:MAG: pyridoxamine 5'-phosphate oxidase family protein [Polyangiaceae bacterium]|nr:pyridoxamine 5'-phosphate oxidase family protein [Polyangiaceae bacterium]
MNARDVIDFANQNPVAWLATAADGMPHVRGLLLWFADEHGFMFNTGSTKNLATELRQNPRVELAFHDPGTDGGAGRMLRVAGTVEILDDEKLMDRLLEERPIVGSLAPAGGPVKVVIFRVKDCTAHFWTWETNLKEHEQPRIQLG